MFRVVSVLAVLMASPAIASVGDLTFKVDEKVEVYSRTCFESIGYVDKDEVGNENLDFNLNAECGKRLAELTRANIGKRLSVYYEGNKLSSANIVSVLRNSFRLSSNEMPRVVLLQLLNDYGVKQE